MSTVLTSPEGDGLPNQRIHYMDNIRAIAMMLGVVLHTAMGYSLLLHDGWIIVDTESSRIVDYITFTIHSFRMPLFFLVAGFFTCMLIRKRGLAGMLKNRAVRVGLPFVIFFPLISALVFGIVYLAIVKFNIESSTINFIKMLFTDPELAKQHPNETRTMHFWFLYYLILFYIAASIFSKIFSLPQKAVQLVTSPAAILFIYPIVALFPVGLVHSPFASAESLVPAVWALGFFGLYFFAGWMYFYQPNMLASVEKYWPALLGVCGVCTVIFFTILPTTLTFEELLANETSSPAYDGYHFSMVISYTFLGWYLSLLSLIAGKKLLDKSNAVLRFISQSSYWVYIIHVPFVFLVQCAFYFLHWAWWLELPLAILAVFTASIMTYLAFVRWTPIGWMLNGRKRKQTELSGNVTARSPAAVNG